MMGMTDIDCLPDAVRKFATLLEDRKAIDLRVYSVEENSMLTDYVVVCSGNSAPQLRALRNSVDQGMKEERRLPRNIEGKAEGSWIVMDYGDVLIHIFHPTAREFYDMEVLLENDARIYRGQSEPDLA